MINGVHFMLYSADAEADRAFIRDKLRFTGVDAGDEWLIFQLPPAEIAVHPAESMRSEIYLMCDDIEATLAELKDRGVQVAEPVADRGWGLIAAIRLPSGADLGIYQPRHPIAHA
jgi:glyoxalase/bleomycin resistance protein/dioxygenase superfamily protein